VLDREPYVLRPATPADRGAVGALLRAAYGTCLAQDYDADVLRRALPAISRPNDALLRCGTWYVVLDRVGDLVACGGYTLHPPGSARIDPGIGHLRHFATHPEHLRRGLGRRIAKAVAHHASASEIRIFEAASTRTATGFYSSLGLAVVGPMTTPIPDGDAPEQTLAFAGVRMRGRLRPSGPAFE